MTDGPRILTIDIETSPAQVYCWDIFKPFISIDMIIRPTRVICFAAKFTDEKKVRFHSEWTDGIGGMLSAARDLLSEADIVVTYNGDNFDIPHLNREFDQWDLSSPSPFHSVDLYKVVKRRNRFLSHKLAYVTQELGLSGKIDNGGFKTWIDLESEDERTRDRARALFTRYNKQDVRTTEELFLKELPNIKLPSRRLFGGHGDCPRCDSRNVQRRGFKTTLTRRYQRYQCLDCGGWFSETRSESSTGATC